MSLENWNLPEKKYQVILADPPWTFKNYSDKWHEEHDESKWVGKQYPLLNEMDLFHMPVEDITADDCVLFLWTTYPKLPEALTLIQEWEFRYKTVAFTWIKQNKRIPSLFWGMGFWTRSNAEICLLATKGKPKRVSASVHQVIMSPVRAHSQKPDEARERIVELMGDVSRIELFARDRVDGWDGWGNEYPDDE